MTAIKPNLFIVGAPKCGTTAWFEYLKGHPDVFVPAVKEPHFFATDMPGMQWPDTIEEYRAQFNAAGDAKIALEASVMYLYSATAAAEIRKFNPDAKILIFLRRQDDYLVSLHHQFVFSAADPVEDFEKSWRLSSDRPPETIPKTCPDAKILNYAAMGRFHEQVARYFAEFPAEQILVIPFEQWTGNPRDTYLKILDFLGIPDDGRTEFPQINEAKFFRIKWIGRLIMHPPLLLQMPVRLLRRLAGRPVLGLANWAVKHVATPGYKTTISPRLREEIHDYYEEDNKKLDELLERFGCSARLSEPKPAQRPIG